MKQGIELLSQWVSISSPSHHLAGLDQMLEALKQAFSPLKADEEIITLPPKKIWTLEGEKKCVFGKVLRLTKRPDAPLQIYLGGHYDTVQPMKGDPIQKGNKLFGSGTADMKGGLFILLEALKRLEEEGGERVGWKVVLNPDEELGSIASKDMIEASIKGTHLALLFEPSLQDGALVSERKGSFNGILHAQGKASHTGRAFKEGKSAIHALAKAIATLPTLEGVQFNIGEIKGGDAPNVVAESAFASINIRYEKSFKKELHTHLKAIKEKEGVTIDLHPLSERPPKLCTKETKKLMHTLESIAAPINWQKTGGVCDGNLIAAKGVPCLDTLGALGGGLHTTDEYCLIPSIEEKITLTSLLLCKLNRGLITWETF